MSLVEFVEWYVATLPPERRETADQVTLLRACENSLSARSMLWHQGRTNLLRRSWAEHIMPALFRSFIATLSPPGTVLQDREASHSASTPGAFS
jgi:hypothetical protein